MWTKSSRIRCRVPGAILIIWILLHVIAVCYADDIVNILSLAWLTQNGTRNSLKEVFSSSMIIPIAVEHFNKRNGVILPAVAQLTGCNAQLRLVGGVQDDEGLPSVAMRKMVDTLTTETIHAIHGPDSSNVSLQ